MKAKFLLNTLCISLLLCSFIQAQEIEYPINTTQDKTFSIPFQPSQHHTFGVSFEVGEPSREIWAAIDMRSSGLWVNNFTDHLWPGIRFRCDLSQTCKPQGSINDFAWIEGYEVKKRILGNSGTLVKEKVNLGSVTLPNTDVLIVNSPSTFEIVYFRQGSLGLNFKRSNPNIPTFFESIKAAGLVDKSIFSMFIDSRYSGELFFGGYDPKRAESEFQYAKWKEDEDPALPGFALQAKGVGYGNAVYSEKYTVLIDMEYGDIMIPEWIIKEIDQEESSRGLSGDEKTCKSIPFLQDIVIEFEEITIRIPPAAYMYYKDATTFGEYQKGCERSLVKVDESKPRIILGIPFLKFFYTVFNLEEKTVGFSKLVSLEQKYPFAKGAKDPEAREASEDYYDSQRNYNTDDESYLLPILIIGTISLLGVLLVAKSCQILCFMISSQSRPESSSPENMVSPKIVVGIPVYFGIDNGNQEESEQESPNIDVGKITIEEESTCA